MGIRFCVPLNATPNGQYFTVIKVLFCVPESESESKSLVGDESQLCLRLVTEFMFSNFGMTNFNGVVFRVKGEAVKAGGGGSIFRVKPVICTVSSPGPLQWRSANPDTSLSSHSRFLRSVAMNTISIRFEHFQSVTFLKGLQQY